MFRKIFSSERISISLYLIISCIGISLIPVILYSILSMFIFIIGLDSVHKLQLEKYINEYLTNKNNISSNFITIITDYDLLPSDIKAFVPRNTIDGKLYKSQIDKNNNSKELSFVIMKDFPEGKYYVVQRISQLEAEAFIKPQITLTIYILLCSSLFILVILLIFIKVLIKRIRQPILKLSNWSTNLSNQNLDNVLPDFTYPELQSIANFIQKSLKKEYNSIRNEELFWRYCSHELRTPISIMSVGLEYLQKLLSNSYTNDSKEINSIRKLKKSVYSMSKIINNLLWLGRNHDTSIAIQKIVLPNIIDDIVNDIIKIYIDEYKIINIKTSIFITYLPKQIVRIVIENIIRNAIQHSLGKDIFIVQNKNKISVINKIGCNNKLRENIGFGLGIEITKKIVEKFKWELNIYTNSQYNIVTLILPK